MDRITFDTSCDEGRVEEGTLDGNVLRTQHENRPEFRVEDDGSVTLLTANLGIEIEQWGENATVEECCDTCHCERSEQ